MKLSNLTATQCWIAYLALLAILLIAGQMIDAFYKPSPVKVQDHDTPAEIPAPAAAAGAADGQALPLHGITRLADVAPRLPDAIAWCNTKFRTLNANARLSVQERYDLRDCLYARYVSEQRKKDEGVVIRSAWEAITRLDAHASDGQLDSAWRHPKIERTAP